MVPTRKSERSASFDQPKGGVHVSDGSSHKNWMGSFYLTIVTESSMCGIVPSLVDEAAPHANDGRLP